MQRKPNPASENPMREKWGINFKLTRPMVERKTIFVILQLRKDDSTWSLGTALCLWSWSH
jgi:hypothetical protein